MTRKGRYIPEKDDALRQRVVKFIQSEEITALNRPLRQLLVAQMVRQAKILGIDPWKRGIPERSAMASVRLYVRKEASLWQNTRRVLEAALDHFEPQEMTTGERVKHTLNEPTPPPEPLPQDDEKDWFLTRLFEAIDREDWRQVGTMAVRAARGDLT